MGFYLRKKETGHAGGRAVLCWARIWPCWARWAGLGADLALLGALGWVGRGIWPCWEGWAGLGVGFGSGGRAGLGWAWDLAVLGAGLGWVGFALVGALGWASSCLHDVFVFIFMCISNGIMGLEQNKAWHS